LIGLSRNFKVDKVGIPRALSYYQYYPGWKAFFEALGAETVVSPPTDKAIFTSGNSRAVAETCLPVKLFFGHVISLADKCDYMFIPALRSLGKEAYYCSKFIGLPDMTRALVPECPLILDPEIDLNKGRRSLYHAIYNLGRHFSSDKSKIKKAVEKAEKAYLAYRKEMSDRGITPVQALNEMHRDEDKPYLEPDISPGLSVAVIGHQYVIYDDYINHRLISRLQAMGVRVFTPEMAEQESLDIAMIRLGGAPHWSFEADIIGAGEHYLGTKVDGIISVAVFGCGPDSMMVDMVRHRAGELRTPFLHLSLDEHTSEGGLVTRLEAFLDMVKRRRVCA
jgi:predicted nucleotide-binding protein (sugar kinase/HSP70/actin superfamily)